MDLYEAYAEAQEQLRFWKETEMRLRKEVADSLEPYSGKETKSTHNCSGLILKVERKHAYTIVKDADFTVLNDSEMACFSWTPRLLLRNYRGLFDKSNIDQVITVREAPPVITVMDEQP